MCHNGEDLEKSGNIFISKLNRRATVILKNNSHWIKDSDIDLIYRSKGTNGKKGQKFNDTQNVMTVMTHSVWETWVAMTANLFFLLLCTFVGALLDIIYLR